jgi:hypothetical protein
MRRTFAIIAGGLSVTLLSAQGPALPPSPKEPPPLVLPPTPVSSLDALKKEREALAKAKEAPAVQDDEDAATAERRLLRKRLEELLRKLGEKPAPGATPPRKDVPEPKVTTEPPKTILPPPVTEVGKAVDVVAQATALYRNGDIQAALGAFGLVNEESLTPGDRAFVKYMKAGCHRRLNNLVEAARLYNEIIAENRDEFYVECSTWQLTSVRWRQDLEKQLSDLRQRREAVPPK